jgi:hypothetical protein
MHRSRTVNLAVVSALAAAFGGCGDTKGTAYCVNKQSKIVENRYCNNEYRAGNYFYSYGGAAAGGYLVGKTLNGGDRVDASDKATNAQRGGFGAAAKAGGVGAVYVKSSSGGS